ncbi:MAG: hypothetical protein AVDCRST_MAG28-4104 [uncultured Rubrobacteraceae bacterium]|uniref:Uncharacterized protein n=1 Tax=uncultured Rubrobacteraceae bacterium TaxID=349277 RepID=A0A6J4RHL1_9ACTN|nr:MAG: hypothetical protein AVDCRST_MAG28-4104 [uncultured Rubrobacteraceae bacterium]
MIVRQDYPGASAATLVCAATGARSADVLSSAAFLYPLSYIL